MATPSPPPHPMLVSAHIGDLGLSHPREVLRPSLAIPGSPGMQNSSDTNNDTHVLASSGGPLTPRRNDSSEIFMRTPPSPLHSGQIRLLTPTPESRSANPLSPSELKTQNDTQVGPTAVKIPSQTKGFGDFLLPPWLLFLVACYLSSTSTNTHPMRATCSSHDTGTGVLQVPAHSSAQTADPSLGSKKPEALGNTIAASMLVPSVPHYESGANAAAPSPIRSAFPPNSISSGPNQTVEAGQKPQGVNSGQVGEAQAHVLVPEPTLSPVRPHSLEDLDDSEDGSFLGYPDPSPRSTPDLGPLSPSCANGASDPQHEDLLDVQSSSTPTNGSSLDPGAMSRDNTANPDSNSTSRTTALEDPFETTLSYCRRSFWHLEDLYLPGPELPSQSRRPNPVRFGYLARIFASPIFRTEKVDEDTSGLGHVIPGSGSKRFRDEDGNEDGDVDRRRVKQRSDRLGTDSDSMVDRAR